MMATVPPTWHADDLLLDRVELQLSQLAHELLAKVADERLNPLQARRRYTRARESGRRVRVRVRARACVRCV